MKLGPFSIGHTRARSGYEVGMSVRNKITSLGRGLRVLQALNEHNDASVIELNQVTGLPRPTLYRILNTLLDEGYVTRGGRGKSYKLTMLVRSLSVGYRDEEWVSVIASPMLSELGDEIVWPVDIGTFDGDAMPIRETTLQTSPLSMMGGYPGRKGFAGNRVPVLSTAMGLAYLAHCSPSRRRAVLEALRDPNSAEHVDAGNNRKVQALVRETKNAAMACGWVDWFARQDPLPCP